jgi:thiosulfate dehydrogenase (quinone) large subunit
MDYPKSKLIPLVLLRLAIGWHFLYEGLVKVLNPAWSSKAYLLDSGGFIKGFFHWIAQHAVVLSITDMMNAWGLSLIGFLLIIGFITRYATIAGMVLLALYYMSHPPLPGISYLLPSDGSYFIINKTLVELLALYVILVFPTAHLVGVERLFKPKNKEN